MADVLTFRTSTGSVTYCTLRIKFCGVSIYSRREKVNFCLLVTHMKTCIYQYWNGSRPAYTYGSEELFRSYADRIGADYFIGDGSISINCLHKRYFGALLPFYSNRFWKYDYVLYVDMDVVPVHDC